LLPTITVTVVALARFGEKAASGAIIITNAAVRSENGFITTESHRKIANNLLVYATHQK
jgi:hypothetical protein